MYETVTDKLQNFEGQLEEVEAEADRRDLGPDYKSCFEMLQEEEQQEILEQLEKYRSKMVIWALQPISKAFCLQSKLIKDEEHTFIKYIYESIW